ncbi:hypothetical protein ABID08_006100 [Rhizobium binae]|uniref:DUF4167 domain-containing protein n=1 Tax=Rhizobium binae TaxID=1138190 RepID=A0ABV2MT43_9HYPH|nr:DUF4167 domain-containing protein [Rhizobium binae]MBX4991092.1 DUF4167 domain-containing protein [Rhizobium binae]NKL49131.1 DUF4167 domain-containing protein [Rhizobium leguminosarum bv. viciae]QSY81868.1 DUF4167 domain-containing protein [Rhizobium binae]
MRPGQQNKRGRGRGNNNNNGGGGNNNNNNFNRKGGNPLTRTYDSSGPDVKIRGTAQHIAEKYAQLARDAQSSGDRVMAENYLQHAEHYNRIIASAQAQMQERFQRDDRVEYNDRDAADRDSDDIDINDNDGDDVVVVQPPQSRQHQPQAQPQPAPAPAPAPAPQPEVIDGTGPQPEIEGIPAEVAMDEEGSAGQPRERQPRRRSAGNRPRRPRRGAEGDASSEGEGASADAPVLAEATSE